MFSQLPRKSRYRRRGAAIYVMVVGLTLIVSAIGFSALMVSRVRLRGTTERIARAEAQLLASSGVEHALAIINSNPNWRSDYLHDTMYPTTPVTLGNGTFNWKLVDDDDNVLDDDPNDPVRVYGIGQVGRSISVRRVLFQPSGPALSCLEAAICSGGSVSVKSGAIVVSTQMLSTNTDADSAGIVNADVEAVGQIIGAGYNGTTTTGITPRTLPGASVFDYYIANGTAIDYYALPSSGPARRIMDVVLSPNNNPFGATNPEGIYVIDCQGELIRVKFSRIVGTLVLLNVNPFSDIEDNLSIEPAVPNYPALLIQGGIEFRLKNIPLSESVRATNFNPPSTPYQGSSDGDMVDTYPSQIKGLVYISGTAEVLLDDTVIEGVLVVGNQLTVGIGETLTVTYDSQYFSNPPPGFRSGETMEILRGSWENVPLN